MKLKLIIVLGHDFKNCLYTALHKHGVNSEKLKKFIREFNNDNENINNIKLIGKNGTITVTEEKDEIHDILKEKGFQKKLNNELRNCIKQYQNVLYLCEVIEDFFNPILASILVFSVCYVIFMLYAAVSVSIIIIIILITLFLLKSQCNS